MPEHPIPADWHTVPDETRLVMVRYLVHRINNAANSLAMRLQLETPGAVATDPTLQTAARLLADLQHLNRDLFDTLPARPTATARPAA